MKKYLVICLIYLFFKIEVQAQIFGPSGAFFHQGDFSPILTFAGSTKSEKDCTDISGVVFDTGGTGTICRLGFPSCPIGWTQAANWSTTTSNTETISWSAYTINYTLAACKGYSPATINIPAGSGERTSGSHAWANLPREQSGYCDYPNGSYQNREPECDDPAYTFKNTAISNFQACDGTGTKWINPHLRYVFLQPGTLIVGAESGAVRTRLQATAIITEIGCK